MAKLDTIDVERAVVGERVVQVVLADLDPIVTGEALAGPGQHLGVEVQADPGRTRAGRQDQVEQAAVARAQVQHPLDRARAGGSTQLGRTLRPVRDRVRLGQVRQRVLDIRPSVLRRSHPRVSRPSPSARTCAGVPVPASRTTVGVR